MSTNLLRLAAEPRAKSQEPRAKSQEPRKACSLRYLEQESV
ncbi:hypothetical protein [Vibrio sp. STUT-A16]|nr:hypothetical protein [Vibrio sp. STUT-A16]